MRSELLLYLLSLLLLLIVWRVLLWRPRPLPGVTRARPWLIGHRGTIGRERENTVSAFRRAFDEGLDGVECDVQLTWDLVLVLVHDTRVGGKRVSGMTLAELRNLNPHVATLGALLAVAQSHPGTLLNLELKNDGERLGRLVRELVRAVDASGMADRVIVSSFDPFALLRLRLWAPRLRVALLTAPDLAPGLRGGAAAGWLHVDALHPRFDQITPELLRLAARRGLLLSTWTVNDPEVVTRLCAAGLDGIMADDPAELRRAAGGGGTWNPNSN